jgi:hypothetical protein
VNPSRGTTAVLRVGNRGAARTLEVRAFSIDRATNAPANKRFTGVSLPAQHDLLVAVQNWDALDVSVEALSFD